MTIGKLLGWREVRRALGSMSVAENIPNRERLTGTRLDPGSTSREKGKRCAHLRAKGG